jgi:hypothetical protein
MNFKKKILFVCYGGGHSAIINLVAKSVLINSNIEIVIIPLNGAIKNIKENFTENQVFTLSNFGSLFDYDIDKIFKYGIMLLDENHNETSGISRLESIFYLGLSFYDLVLEKGYELAFKSYSEKKRQAFLPESVMKTILLHIGPDLVITTSSPRFEFATIKAAKYLGIPSLQILDLFGDDFPLASADHIVVMNDNVKKKLIKKGVKNSIFHSFGQPVLEETIIKVKNVNVDNLKNVLNLRDNRVLLFSPTQNIIINEDLSVKEIQDGKLINDLIFNILDEIANLFNLKILIRPHPSDNINNYISYIESKECYIYQPDLDVYEAIAISDFTLSYASTLSLQSLVCGKLSFTYNQNPEQKYYWTEFSCRPFIYSSNYIELIENLKKFIDGSSSIDTDEFFQSGFYTKLNNLIKTITAN